MSNSAPRTDPTRVAQCGTALRAVEIGDPIGDIRQHWTNGGTECRTTLLANRVSAGLPCCIIELTNLHRNSGFPETLAMTDRFHTSNGNRKRSAEAVMTEPVSRPVQESSDQSVHAILLALSVAKGAHRPLPHIRFTLPVAERFHRAIVRRVCRIATKDRIGRVDCPEVTGHDPFGQPLAQGHRHAHLLPLDLDGDDHLDHVLVWAPMGLGPVARHAIRSLRRTWTRGGRPEFDVEPVNSDVLNSIGRLPERLRPGMASLFAARPTRSGCDSPFGAVRWLSRTPMVLPRYVKKRGKNSLEGQVQAELASRGLPPAKRIETTELGASRYRRGRFICVRRDGSPLPANRSHTLVLVFDRPVIGPIALGYASHFGMGLFEADRHR